MLKNKGKIKGFVKRQVAKVLAITMIATSFLSSGMAMSPVQAAEDYKMSYGDELINEMVRIMAGGTKYVWGGTTESGGVDCRAYVKLGLKNTFGTIEGYWVDDNNKAILSGGKKQMVSLAAWDWDAIKTYQNGPSDRICIEGTNPKTGQKLRSYYQVYVVGQTGDLQDTRDISYNGRKYSSLIAEACQYPGTIVLHNGHAGVGIGEYSSKQEILDAYKQYDINKKGSGTDGKQMVRFDVTAYNKGNSYSYSDSRYWFGKTAFLHASSSSAGLCINNTTTSGKVANPPDTSTMAILVCEQEVPTKEIRFTKKDSVTGLSVGGAEYGIYSDKACTQLEATFTTMEGVDYVKADVPFGKYYVKEISAPYGYSLNEKVIQIDATSKEPKTINLTNDPVNSTIMIQKVDEFTRNPLSKTELTLYEYDLQNSNPANDRFVYTPCKTKDGKNFTLKYDEAIQAFTIDGTYVNNMGQTITTGSLVQTENNMGIFKVAETKAQNGYYFDDSCNHLTEECAYEHMIDLARPETCYAIGDTALTNQAITELQIKKVDEDGNPIEGVEFEFMYNGNVHTAITNANGIAIFSNMLTVYNDSGVLFEREAPEIYIPSDYAGGQRISLKYDGQTPTQDADGVYRFVTQLQIVNHKKQTQKPVNDVINGRLKFTKTGESIPLPINLEGAGYVLYKNVGQDDIMNPDAIAQYAYAKFDNNYKFVEWVDSEADATIVKSDANGVVDLYEVPTGVMYIKEVVAPEGYSVRRPIGLNFTKDAAKYNIDTGKYELNGTINPGRTMNYRQTVELSITKVDELTGNPIQGVTFDLFTKSDILTLEGKTVKAGTKIGTYVTDENGQILVTSFGTAEEPLVLNAGTANEFQLAGSPFMNGKYAFVETKAADGYILDQTECVMDAAWSNNGTSDETVSENGECIVSPYGLKLTCSKMMNNKRESVVINVTKKDSEKNGSIDYYPGLVDDTNAVDNNQVATLKGAKYLLFTNSEIEMFDSEGTKIPANTLVGTYSTDADGKFVIDHLTLEDVEYPVPNGQYKLVEVESPQGYAIDETPLFIDVKSNADDENDNWTLNKNYSNGVHTFDVTHKENIIKQDLVINKFSNLDNTNQLSGAVFRLYNVGVYEAKTLLSVPFDEESEVKNGFNAVDRKTFLENVELYDVPAFENRDFVTNATEPLTIEDIPYGDYVLVETVVPADYDQEPDAIYVQIPLVEEQEGSDEETEGSFFIHELNKQPEVPYNLTVVNISTLETPELVVKIEKVDADTDSIIINNPATFKLSQVLYNEEEDSYTYPVIEDELKTDDTGILAMTLEPGKYLLTETDAPEGYQLGGDMVLEVSESNVKATYGEESKVYGLGQDLTFAVKFPNKIIPPEDIVEPRIPDVHIIKYEADGATLTPVVGAKLQILQNGEVVELADGTKLEWMTSAMTGSVDETTGLASTIISNLPVGEYVLHEAETPDGYVTAPDQTFRVEETINANEKVRLLMEDKKTQLSVEKKDAVSDRNIVGAELTVYDNNGDVVMVDGEPLVISTSANATLIQKLPVGQYYIDETKVPFGYVYTDEALVNGQLVEKVEGKGIPFEIKDSADPTTIVMTDERVAGKIAIVKTDANSSVPLENVKFEVMVKETVFDPITHDVLFSDGQVIDTITTNADGYGITSKELPVGIYDENGFVQNITYTLVEVEAAPGQYALAEPLDVVLSVGDGTEKVVTVEFPIGNSKPIINVTKYAMDTYCGPYANKEKVAVVEKTDEIEYTISIKNEGAVPAYNLILKDVIPENTKFVSYSEDERDADLITKLFNENDNAAYWTISKINAGQTIDLKLTVEVTNNKACEIANVAQWQMPQTTTEVLDPETNTVWNETNYVVHQVVEFEKTSEIKGGTDELTAQMVADGDVIKYIMTFKAVDDLYDVVVSDQVPGGLTIVPGSIKVNGAVDENATFHPTTRVLKYSAMDVNNETVIFEFEATVDPTDVGVRYDYVNIAKVDYKSGTGMQGTMIPLTLNSDRVTHYTEKLYTVTKTATPVTYEGDATYAKDVTVLKLNDEIQYKIFVENTGECQVNDITVEDFIPEGLEYVSHQEVDGVVIWDDVENGKLAWYIDKLAVDETKELVFTAKVVEQKAQLITNTAKYDIYKPEFYPELPADAKKTNDVVHQVIEFHKMSEVKGGTNKDNATKVSVGDTITYTMQVISKSDLSNIKITDIVPAGLTYAGNPAVKLDDGSWGSANVETSKTDEGRDIVEFKEYTLKAGSNYFKFDVTVDSIPNNSEKFYINQAELEYDVFTNTEDSKKETLLSEEVSHMTSVKMTGSKTGVVETFVGEYAKRENVTVVENNEEITYSITVTNEGISKLKDLTIKDVVPTNTKFVSVDSEGRYDKNSNSVTWTIDEVPAKGSVTVKMTVKVDVGNKATEIRNKAEYFLKADKEPYYTDEVIHQTVALTKSASVEYGDKAENAKTVAIGSAFSYIITFEALNPVYGLSVQDKIPAGLTFMKDTATYQMPNSAAVKVNDLEVDKENQLFFPTLKKVDAGKTEFKFDVKVRNVKDFNTEYYFINKATATVKANEDSNKLIDLESNEIVHKTLKTKDTPTKPDDKPVIDADPEKPGIQDPVTGETLKDTPKLGFDTMDKSMVWSLIAVLSAIAAVGLGYYGFFDKKKRK